MEKNADIIPVVIRTEAGREQTARWISESASRPPARAVAADDAMNADTAFRLACEGCALIWRGDFQNARQLLDAMARRADRKKNKKKKAPEHPAEAFHRHRMDRSRRARILGMILVEVLPDGRIPLRRAPDVRQAVSEALGSALEPSDEPFGGPYGGPPADHPAGPALISLREILGMIGAHEWRRKGIGIPFLKTRIYPHYGVFPPTRSEYVELAAKAPLPAVFHRYCPPGSLPAGPGDPGNPGTAINPAGPPGSEEYRGKPPDPVPIAPDPAPMAMDIGTGTGVLSALLAERGVPRILATDNDPRAVACARENMRRAGLDDRVRVVCADLFPAKEYVSGELSGYPEKASLIVFNPPWIPAKPVTQKERAVYDPKSAALHRFLRRMPERLDPEGEAWLLISDLAERLGLRPAGALTGAFGKAGLKVIARIDAPPVHNRSRNPDDPLHFARHTEVVSLWRLGPA